MDGDDINGAYKISLDVCMSYYIVMNEVKRFIKEWAKGWGQNRLCWQTWGHGDSRLKDGCFWPSVKSALC